MDEEGGPIMSRAQLSATTAHGAHLSKTLKRKSPLLAPLLVVVVLVVLAVVAVVAPAATPCGGARRAPSPRLAVLGPLLKVERARRAKLVGDALDGEGAIEIGKLVDHLAGGADEERGQLREVDHREHHRRRLRVQPAEESLEVRLRELRETLVHQLGVERAGSAEVADHAVVLRNLLQKPRLRLQLRVRAMPLCQPPRPLGRLGLHLSETMLAQLVDGVVL
mmetsp:Transcript_3196/g.5285  ORF Transcript_3196/g.5285 Transcript_3196/m.5285 type:complete len:222 (+) Transcript_3196:156-821(+)